MKSLENAGIISLVDGMAQIPLLIYCTIAAADPAEAWRANYLLNSSTSAEQHLKSLQAFSLWCSVRACAYPDSSNQIDRPTQVDSLADLIDGLQKQPGEVFLPTSSNAPSKAVDHLFLTGQSWTTGDTSSRLDDK